jgi:hypothetical protein
MHQRVTRLVLPMAAMVAVTAAGSAARAGGAAPSAPCPADVRAPVSVIPGASPSAGENAPSLGLALTARGTRAAGGDLVEYRITARPARTPLRDITVTARLTCVPGDALLAGRPSASTGRATAGPRAVRWQFDLDKAPATATFVIRVRPNARGGPLVGEIATTGPVSNCPALRAADTPIDAYCRVTVLVPGLTAGAAPPAARPARPAPVPAAPPAVHPAVPPIVSPSVPRLPAAPPAPVPAAPPAPGGALPVLPQTGPVPGGGPSPSPSMLSQLNRAPIVPAGPAAPDAATQAADPPGAVMRPADSRGDLGGRALAFLIGGVAFLLIAVAIAGSLIGVPLRRRQDEDEDESGLEARPRPPVHPRTLDDDLRRRTPPNPPRTIIDVVRRTAEAGEPRPYTEQTAGLERPAGRTVADE